MRIAQNSPMGQSQHACTSIVHARIDLKHSQRTSWLFPDTPAGSLM